MGCTAVPRSGSGSSPSGGPTTSAFASRPCGNSQALELLVFPGPRVGRRAFAFLKNSGGQVVLSPNRSIFPCHTIALNILDPFGVLDNREEFAVLEYEGLAGNAMVTE